MRNPKNRILLAALESQLELLKRRLAHPDAAQWRQLGKLTRDFDLWLERARPLIPCAARLISLRVGQISDQLFPEAPSDKAARQLRDLLDEAGRHLSDPLSPVQVIDLDRKERAFLLGKELCGAEQVLNQGRVGLPFDMAEVPPALRPSGDAPLLSHYIIPN